MKTDAELSVIKPTASGVCRTKDWEESTAIWMEDATGS